MGSPLDYDDVLSNYFTPTPRVRALQEQVNTFLALSRKANHKVALPLLGPPGSGKTTFAKQYPVLFEKQYGQKLRSLYIEISSRSGKTDVSVDFLMKLGDPNPQYGLLPMRFERLRKMMVGKYDIVLLDEFHRLINSDTQRVEKDAADWVTMFLNAKICPLVMVGEMKCKRVFEDSDQFEGRTRAIVPVRPYDWSNVLDRREYQGLLMAWEQLLDFPQPSGLGGLDCALRIYQFSRGLMRQSADLVSNAAYLAKEEGAPSIRREHLATAVDQLRVGSRARQPNSFRLDTVQPVKPAPMDRTKDEGDR